MAEETYSPPKNFRPKHSRISELKAEAVKKDRRKKLTQSKLAGGAENTAHTRVNAAPEIRQESEQVGVLTPHPRTHASQLAQSPLGSSAQNSIEASFRTQPWGEGGSWR